MGHQFCKDEYYMYIISYFYCVMTVKCKLQGLAGKLVVISLLLQASSFMDCTQDNL